MENLRDQQIAWLRHIERTSGRTLTEIARVSDVNPSTLSKFITNEEGHTLTSKIVRRIEAATRVAAYESHSIPRILEFSEEEASPYTFPDNTINPIEQLLKTYVAGSPTVNLWELKTDNLAAVGYPKGMVAVVETGAMALPRDNVIAQRYDTRRGTAETIFRHYRPPYLLTAPRDGEPAAPEIVDGERVIIRGVLLAGFHIRR